MAPAAQNLPLVRKERVTVTMTTNVRETWCVEQIIVLVDPQLLTAVKVGLFLKVPKLSLKL